MAPQSRFFVPDRTRRDPDKTQRPMPALLHLGRGAAGVGAPAARHRASLAMQDLRMRLGHILSTVVGLRRIAMTLTRFAVDDSNHSRDGLVLHGWDGDEQVTGFISRRVMADLVDPRQPHGRCKSLFRTQYNTLGGHNLAAIERIVTSKYRRGLTFNRQHPFVDV